ncbi:MAG: hypothetical protein U9O55_04695 [Patescibacteria group bacterium]|nr:hypothetical protein [Patescibacteria group bacterium]
MLLIFTTFFILINIFLLKSAIIGVIFGMLYFFLLSKKLSKRMLIKLPYSILLILSIVSFVGALIYFFYKLDNLAIALTLIITAIIVCIIPYQEKFFIIKNRFVEYSVFLKINYLIRKILIFAYLFFVFILFDCVFALQTTSAIRSPWKIIPNDFFIFYFIATLILLLIILSSKRKKCLILIFLHFLVSSSVAVIVYKLGYGFDQFIHQATEKVIIEQGAIYPKPLYYLGQYSLVVVLSKIFVVSHIIIDKLLVIILFSAFLPFIIYESFKNLSKNKNILFALPLIFLIFPFGSFIVTTPQNLANLFILITIFLALPYINGEKKYLLPLIFLTLATLAIHPLAGIPVLIFLSFILLINFLKKSEISNRAKKLILFLFLLLGSISIPSIFLINSFLSGLKINFSLIKQDELLSCFYNLKFYFVNNFNLFFDFAYFYKLNFYLIIFFSSIIIVLFYYKKLKLFLPYVFTFIILFVNFLILKFLFSFDFLINYEQNDYTQRILQISFYFLYPIVLFGFMQFLKALTKQDSFLKILFIVLISGLITSSFYISYPRADDYETSSLFNITDADIETVKWIENDAQGNDFIVLSNQQVSASAIKEFSFKKYFDSQFYYSIPTSSYLYQYYLEMVNDSPKKEYIIKAMENANVKQGYFVINNYWWKFKEMSEEAKKTADSYKIIGQGENVIFKYKISE